MPTSVHGQPSENTLQDVDFKIISTRCSAMREHCSEGGVAKGAVDRLDQRFSGVSICYLFCASRLAFLAPQILKLLHLFRSKNRCQLIQFLTRYVSLTAAKNCRTLSSRAPVLCLWSPDAGVSFSFPLGVATLFAGSRYFTTISSKRSR